MIKKLKNKLSSLLHQKQKSEKLDLFFVNGLSQKMRPALEWLIREVCDEDTKSTIEKVERRRKEIASYGKKELPIWYSPKPGSAGLDTSLDARPMPGKVLRFTMERVAATGKNKRWGAALYLIARGFESKVIFELGACAGISAMYLASAQNVKTLITVEGSEALANLAKKSLQTYQGVKVVNKLFDEAIDTELSLLGKKVDLVYVDGHHEKTATIHYFNRVLPFLKGGAVVLFDDISWSYDMRDAWKEVSRRLEFSDAMDLGEIGVCIVKQGAVNDNIEPKYWDLQPILGRARIGDPHGWKQ